MDSETGGVLSETEESALGWIRSTYFPAVHALMDSNRTYLNQGISWSIGILTAVIIFGFSYISPLQDVTALEGEVAERSFSAILSNITDGDILFLTAVLSLSCAFVSNFMSRSIKGYLNLMRYVALYSHCLRLSGAAVPVSSADLAALTAQIKQYDDDFCPPLRLRIAVGKMITELGYGLFFAVLLGLYAGAAALWHITDVSLGYWWFWAVLAFGPVWLCVELYFLGKSTYFQFKEYAAEDWPEANKRR